jgi:putative chitinase
MAAIDSLQDLIDSSVTLRFEALIHYPGLTREIQTILGAEPDGIYGSRTHAALVAFKIHRKLTGGNAIGPTTARALLAARPLVQNKKPLVSLSTARAVYQNPQVTQRQVDSLNEALHRFGIVEPEDIRMFLAQTGHESAGLVFMEEIWGPSRAQLGYEGRVDLGNTVPGDGYRFRGVDPLQMTGRANYQAFANYVGDPNVMLGADYCAVRYCFSPSGFWWRNNKASEAIKKGATIVQISGLVNAGSLGASPRIINGLEDRIYRYGLAKDWISG